MSRPNNQRDAIVDRFSELMRRGIIFSWESSQSFDTGSIEFRFDLTPDRSRGHGRVTRLTQEEIYSMRNVHFWLDTVTEHLMRESCAVRAAHPELFEFDSGMHIRAMNDRSTREADRFVYDGMMFGNAFHPDSAAEAKAETLFKQFAGAAPLIILKSGKPIALKGSAGGQYKLFARRAYCVERQPDGARMCAVVPRVPLYDHLLGIKLTIETDELLFLKTANVAEAFGTRSIQVDHVAVDGVRYFGSLSNSLVPAHLNCRTAI